nr:MAG: hypothetical protein CM15mV30_0450 [uncultured marine virus]
MNKKQVEVVLDYIASTPILDIEIRYKGSYTANPQFQATATADLKKIFKSMNKESVELDEDVVL